MPRMALSARAQSYIVGNDTLMAFSALVVLIRFYLRIRSSRRRLWWDDYFLGLSLILAIAFAGCLNVSMAYSGLDRHMWEIPQSMLPTTYKTYVILKVLFILASSSIRMSLLCFYLWLVKDLGSRLLQRTIYISIVVNAALCIVCCFLSVLTCRKPSDFWTIPRPASSICMDDGHVTTAMGCFLCLADIVVNTLPLPIVAKLKMPIRQRVSIAALLCLGAVATIAGIVREYWVYRALVATTDSTYEALPLWVCADVEIYVALICACGPAFKPLYSRLQHRGNTTGFVRRRHSSDQIYVENGTQGYDLNDRESRLQKAIFDGGLATNITRICVASQDHLPTSSKPSHDEPRPSVAETDSGLGHNPGSFGIQVVTCIQLNCSDVGKQNGNGDAT